MPLASLKGPVASNVRVTYSHGEATWILGQRAPIEKLTLDLDTREFK